MGLWQQLLSVETPGAARLEALDWSLRGVAPLVWVILLTVVAGVLVGLFYMLESRRLGLARRGLLILVRTSAVGLLCFLVIRPIQCTAVFKGTRPRAVVLLLDNSQSMSQRDRRLSQVDRARVALVRGLVPLYSSLDDPALDALLQDISDNPARVDLVRDALQHPELKLLKRLKAHAPLQIYLFGSRLRRLQGDRNSTAPGLGEQLKADEGETALADAINEVLLKGDGDLPAALVIVTDGNDNASKLSLADAARACARLEVPLHIYGVGSSASGTLQWREVNVPNVLFADDTVSVPVRWRALGLKQGTVEMVLSMNGKEVARREVPATDGDDLRETITFTPDKKLFREERQDLTATIRLKGSDVVGDESKRPVRLIDRKVKVLVVENAPRWEFKFLQRALLRDRRVEARFVLLQADRETLTAGPPYLASFPSSRKDLFGFDLLILGDIPLKILAGERIQWIRDFVTEGRGLVQIAGRLHAPADYHGTALAEVLPVEFQPIRYVPNPNLRSQGFEPQLTRTGEMQEMMQLADRREENEKTWRELPALYWHYPVTRLRPGAWALLTHPTLKAGDEPMPLLALHYFGKGQVLFVGFEETWRWRFNTREQVFSRFWGQIVYQLGLPNTIGTRTTQLLLDRPEILLGRPGMVYARLYDDNFKPLVRKSVSASLEQVDGPPGPRPTQIIEMQPIPGQEGEYRAVLPHDRIGRFVLKLAAGEPVSLDYRVGMPFQHELALRGLAEEPLREAARLSGGAFYHEEDLRRLPDQVPVRMTPFVHRQQVLPRNLLALLLFVGLVSVEWVLRKYSNLS